MLRRQRITFGQRGLLGLERVGACPLRWIVWFAHLFDKPVGKIARRIVTHALSFLGTG
jgi:hypothetical protein